MLFDAAKRRPGHKRADEAELAGSGADVEHERLITATSEEPGDDTASLYRGPISRQRADGLRVETIEIQIPERPSCSERLSHVFDDVINSRHCSPWLARRLPIVLSCGTIIGNGRLSLTQAAQSSTACSTPRQQHTP